MGVDAKWFRCCREKGIEVGSVVEFDGSLSEPGGTGYVRGIWFGVEEMLDLSVEREDRTISAEQVTRVLHR